MRFERFNQPCIEVGQGGADFVCKPVGRIAVGFQQVPYPEDHLRAIGCEFVDFVAGSPGQVRHGRKLIGVRQGAVDARDAALQPVGRKFAKHRHDQNENGPANQEHGSHSGLQCPCRIDLMCDQQPSIRSKPGRTRVRTGTMAYRDHAPLRDRRIEIRPGFQIAGEADPVCAHKQIVRRSPVGGPQCQAILDPPHQIRFPAAGVDIGQTGKIDIDSLASAFVQRGIHRSLRHQPEPQHRKGRQQSGGGDQPRKNGTCR